MLLDGLMSLLLLLLPLLLLLLLMLLLLIIAINFLFVHLPFSYSPIACSPYTADFLLNFIFVKEHVRDSVDDRIDVAATFANHTAINNSGLAGWEEWEQRMCVC